MSEHDDESASIEAFAGQVRLFPLPNLVLFPHVVQPLHVFERRYVDLLEDAIAGDRLIAMAVLQPGWETDYEGRPPIAPTACLGRVLTWQALPENRYNLLLLGLRRVRLIGEMPSERSFREARAEIVEDAYPSAAAAGRDRLRRRLIEAFEDLLPRMKDAQELFNQLSLDTISLGALADVIAYAIDLPLEAKLALLAEPQVDRRAASILHHLKSSQEDDRPPRRATFPPAFSGN